MSIEKHQCEGGDFHTTTDFLDCECGAIIPQPNRSGGIVQCGSCKATNFAEDLADARVEEIVQAVANANDPTKVVPENCVAIGESRMLELEEKERRYDELHGHWLRLVGTTAVLRVGMADIAKVKANENSEPDRMGEALHEIHGIASRCIESTKHGEEVHTRPDEDGFCSWIVELSVAPLWVADGFELTNESAVEMLAETLSFASAERELKAKVIARPKQDRIHNLQCGKEEV